MKRLIFAMMLCIPFILTGCKKDSGDNTQIEKARKIAWASLTEQEKSTVTTDWKNAPVNEAKYKGRTVYAIRLNTTQDALAGPIVVYIDRISFIVLGYALRF